jgi:hypothetical protein
MTDTETSSPTLIPRESYSATPRRLSPVSPRTVGASPTWPPWTVF